MKKIIFCFFISLSFIFSSSINAQTYTLGDISVTLSSSGVHDSIMCTITGTLTYTITIQNSFVGDFLIVKNTLTGTTVYNQTNSTGQTPWIVSVPVGLSSMGDYGVIGGYAHFVTITSKIISGTDTLILDANQNAYDIYEPFPCEYGDVSGRTYIDFNNNCVFNAGIDSTLHLSNIPSHVENLTSGYQGNSMGYYTSDGSYVSRIQTTWMTDYTFYLPSWVQFIFPLNVCNPTSYTYTTCPQVNVDFAMHCSHNLDVRCGAVIGGVIRPAIPFSLYPFVQNIGCAQTSGVMKLVLDPNVVYDAALSVNPADNTSGDTLMWNYNNISSLVPTGFTPISYWNSFLGGIHLTPVNVNVGDQLCFTVITSVPFGDADASNNILSFCLPVMNSFDPNFVEVTPKGDGAAGNIPPTTSRLTYTIHFQNTGTAPAINISVIDTLDSNLQAGTLEILSTSHNMTPEWLAPNVVKFKFNFINLPDSNTNEALSHGVFSYNILLNETLPIGTQIKNKASIYFDTNDPVVTNTTLNTIAVLGVEELASVNGNIRVYPNPFNENTTFIINSDRTNEIYSIEIIDMLGKKVKVMNDIRSNIFQLSASGLESGILFYKVYNSKGAFDSSKLIVE